MEKDISVRESQFTNSSSAIPNLPKSHLSNSLDRSRYYIVRYLCQPYLAPKSHYCVHSRVLRLGSSSFSFQKSRLRYNRSYGALSLSLAEVGYPSAVYGSLCSHGNNPLDNSEN